MIRHIVLTKFKSNTPEDKIDKIYGALMTLTQQLPGAYGFAGGRSKSPEQIERGFMHGFVIDFDSWDALHNYANNPTHAVLSDQLVENAVGGIDGILVFDMEV